MELTLEEAAVNKTRVKKGISLAELAIATVLISVLACIGYMQVSDSIEAQSAKSGFDQIAFAVLQAKQFARTKGVNTALTFTQGSNNFDITANGASLTDENNTGATSGKLPDNIIIISNSCSSIGFNVKGTLIDSDGATIYNDCRIVVGYANGPQESITIKGKTGNIEND